MRDERVTRCLAPEGGTGGRTGRLPVSCVPTPSGLSCRRVQVPEMRRRIAATRRLHGLRTGRTPSTASAGDFEPGASARPAAATARHTPAVDAGTLQAGPSSHHGAGGADSDADTDPATGVGLRPRRSPDPHADSGTPACHDRGNCPPKEPAHGTRAGNPRLADRWRRPSDELGGWARARVNRDRVARRGSPSSRTHPHRHPAFVAPGAEPDGSRRRVSGSFVSVGPGVWQPRTAAATHDERPSHARTADAGERARASIGATGVAGTGAVDPELDFRRCSGARRSWRSAACSRCQSVRRSPRVGPALATSTRRRGRAEDEQRSLRPRHPPRSSLPRRSPASVQRTGSLEHRSGAAIP